MSRRVLYRLHNDNEEVHTVGVPGGDEVEIIRIDQVPTKIQWKLTPLYRIAANGGQLYWSVGFDGVDQLVIDHGYVIVKPTYTKVILNSSGRTMAEQALLEARHRYTEKFRAGYMPAGSMEPPQTKLMKGLEYTKSPVAQWPVMTQPKLNGIRLSIQRVRGTEVLCKTYGNKHYTHLTHITDELMNFFPYLPNYVMLDGELYNHDMDFTELISAVKTVKRKHPDLERVQYWIFDIAYEPSEPFEKRIAILTNAYGKFVEDKGEPKSFYCVPTLTANSYEEMEEQHEKFVGQGMEGIMIKKISHGSSPGTKTYDLSLYKAGKSNHILKYKNFQDEEAVVLAIKEAKGTEAGTAILIVQDIRGNEFPLRMRGSFQQRRLWFENPETIIGKEISFRYQELSCHGVPRFPIGLAVRDYE